MRIVIDMQGAQTESRFRGIGRYTLSLTQAIVRNRGGHEIILALSGLFPDTIEPIRATFEGLLPQENIRVWYCPGVVRDSEPNCTWRREVAERIREAFLASLRPDVVHVSSLFEGFLDDAVTSIAVFAPQIQTVVTLYDLIPLLNPAKYLKCSPVYEKYYLRKVEYLKRADQWLAISESAAAEGRQALALPADSVVNISAACDDVFHHIEISKSEEQSLRTRFGITRPFILHTGGADARKNLHRLIRAYAGLPKPLCEAHQLVLAGKMAEGEITELLETARSAGLNVGQLLMAGYVTDKDLTLLYSQCTVFVLPSFHEGFGLPALEAMSCGAAVIGANTSSVPEVISHQDALFDPYKETAIERKLFQVLDDPIFRGELAAHGRRHAKKFSWDKSAQRAITAFETLHLRKTSNQNACEFKSLLPNLVNAIGAVVPIGISDVEILKLAHAVNRIHADDAPKHLLLDISELVLRDAKSGVQRVTRSILKELLKNPPEGYVIEPVYAGIDIPGYRYARQFTAGFRGLTQDLDDELITCHPGDIFLGLDLQHQVVLAQSEFLIALRLDGIKVYFVVYDLLPVLMPQFFPPHVDIVHKAWLEILSSFDGVVCISRAVSDELAEWQGVNGSQRVRPFKNTWFHLGADIENSAPSRGLSDDADQVLKTLALRTTFLMVGTLEPRKGHAQVLEAFEQLWQTGQDVNLVIVGKVGWMVEILVDRLRPHSKVNKRLFWLEGISDEYLEKIYTASSCLIAASYGEGFGLPLIEAAQHNLPILARDIPVFREVAGEHAYYFNAQSTDALTQAIKKWLALYEAGQHPKSNSMNWLTWKESAEILGKKILSNGDVKC